MLGQPLVFRSQKIFMQWKKEWNTQTVKEQNSSHSQRSSCQVTVHI